jgi:hypothetical protein
MHFGLAVAFCFRRNAWWCFSGEADFRFQAIILRQRYVDVWAGGLDGGQIMPRVQLPAVTPKRRAWNRGRLVGQKRPLLPKQVPDPPLSGMLSAALFISNFQVGGIGL